MEDKKHEVIQRCKDYLSEFPNAKKVVFIGKEASPSELDVRSYLDLLMESYGLSERKRYKRNPIINSQLDSYCTEFADFFEICNKIIELETHYFISKEAVYQSFIEHFDFCRKHTLYFNNFKQSIEYYVKNFCNDEISHRIVGEAVLKWLNDSEYANELLAKCKEQNFSLSYNLRKIINNKITELSPEEKAFIKAQCVDEIMLDKIICNLYQNGLLENVELGKIQIPQQSKRKADNLAAQLEHSKRWYMILTSIEKKKFIPNSWAF